MKNNTTSYKASITETSRELSAYERVKFKDVSDAAKLDELTQEKENLVISPVMYIVLDITNEKSDNPNYNNYIIVDADGNKYVTGSQSFWNSFMDIWDDMEDFNEPWSIKVMRKPSKNFKGKDFLTCSLV